MSEGLRPRTPDAGQSPRGTLPTISVCRSRPERFVFIESDNTDGWIATDSTVEPSP